MRRWFLTKRIVCAAAACGLVSCQSVDLLDSRKPSRADLRYAAARQAVIVASPLPQIPGNIKDFLRMGNHSTGYTGGSAAPISSDGYFLTAEHIITKAKNKPLHVLYLKDSVPCQGIARVVWRNRCHDLALIHITQPTPQYFRFSKANNHILENTPIIHTGANSGLKSVEGLTVSALKNDCTQCSSQKLFINVLLEAGDSGGAILNSQCELIGIASGVEYMKFIETPIFTHSHGNRPDPSMIDQLIKNDRSRE